MLLNLFSSYPVLYIALTVVSVLLILKLEKHSKIVQFVSAPVLVIFAGCLFTTLQITPSYAPVFDAYFSYLMPVAAALFVLKFDLIWLYRHGKRITFMFLLTSISTFVSVTLISNLFDFSGRAAITGGIIAEYIGGPQNMLAVLTAIPPEDSVFSQFIFVDNIWAIFAMMIVFLLPSMKWFLKNFRCVYDKDGVLTDENTDSELSPQAKAVTSMEDSISLWSVAVIAGIGLTVIALITPFCAWASGHIQNTLLNQLLSTPLIVSPFLVLIIAALFQKPLTNVQGEDTVAYFIYLMTLFTVGSYTNFLDILNVNITMLFLLIAALACNIGFSLLLAKIFHIPYEEVCLSVAASYAGPGEAYVIAKTNRWFHHAKLGVMIGLLGYVIGGPLGLIAANLLGA